MGRGVGAGGDAGGAAPEGDSRPEGHEAPSAALHEAAQERALLELKGRITVAGLGALHVTSLLVTHQKKGASEGGTPFDSISLTLARRVEVKA